MASLAAPLPSLYLWIASRQVRWTARGAEQNQLAKYLDVMLGSRSGIGIAAGPATPVDDLIDVPIISGSR
jgi:hypothetical protein